MGVITRLGLSGYARGPLGNLVADLGPHGTSFNGTSDYFLRPFQLLEAADSPNVMISIWMKPSSITGFKVIIGSDLGRCDMFQSNAKVQLTCRNSVNTVVLSYLNATDMLVNQWYHFWFVAQTNADPRVYRNGVLDTGTIITNIAGNIDFTQESFSIGANTSGTQRYAGCLSEVYFNNDWISPDTPGNKDKFITPAGTYVSLGQRGELPTAFSPLIYKKNPFGTFGFNSGVGGSFLEAPGSGVVACADAPPTTPSAANVNYRPIMRPRRRASG